MIKVNHFPLPGEDQNVLSQQYTLGGTSFNVSDVLRQMKLPYMLCSPVGTGLYAEIVRTMLSEKNIPVFADIPDMDNGCCYCIITEEKKHSFIANHGAEYLFKPEWYENVNMDEVDSIYFSGLEMEENTSHVFVSWLEKLAAEFAEKERPLKLFFDPGPRICMINQNLMDRLLALSPVLHMNNFEATEYAGTDSLEKAAAYLHSRTKESVVITNGDKGAFVHDHHTGKGYAIPGFKSSVIDTIGAGDAHCGMLIAGFKQGMQLEMAVLRANKYASEIVRVLGATMPDDRFPEEYRGSSKK